MSTFFYSVGFVGFSTTAGRVTRGFIPFVFANLLLSLSSAKPLNLNKTESDLWQ